MVTNVQNMISFPKCFNAYTSTLITASFIEALNQNHRVWYFLKNQETVQLKWLTVSRSYSYMYNFDYQVYEEVLGQADPKSLWFFFVSQPICLSLPLYLSLLLSLYLSISFREDMPHPVGFQWLLSLLQKSMTDQILCVVSSPCYHGDIIKLTEHLSKSSV